MSTDSPQSAEPPGGDGSSVGGGKDPRSGLPLTSLVALAAAALVVLLVIFNVGGGSDNTADNATDGTGLESFAFQTVAGETITLAAYEGQPLVLNFFASWCAPCRAELPAFDKVSSEVSADGVVFVGISRDSDTNTWQSFVEEVGISFETVYEGANPGSFEFLDAKGMPTTVFVRADGSVAEVFSGLLPEATLSEKITEHLIEG